MAVQIAVNESLKKEKNQVYCNEIKVRTSMNEPFEKFAHE